MGFWSFMRDMLVFDWLFGHRKKESFWEQSQRENQRYADYSHKDVYNSYRSYGKNDSDQQEFFASKALCDDDDDLDSDLFDDDF